MEMILDTLQQEAIRVSCDTSTRIAGVTGQAGTGKTTIMRKVYDAFSEAGHSVALAAPTGKAAKRISEATGIPAVTIHRLLEFTHPGDPDPKTGKPLGFSVPRRNPQNPLDQSVLLLDEASMINKQLWRDVIDALRPGGLVRCFGDVNQLPPIEEYNDKAPSPFMDVLKKFPSVTLTNIYRQGEGSSIVKNGHRILNGLMPFPSDDFKMIWTGDLAPADPVTKLLHLVKNSGIDFGSLDNQIVTPINKSWVGQIALNMKVQDLIQGTRMYDAVVMPRKKWAQDQTLMLCKGDKIVWTVNDYNLEIYNGEVGIVEEIVNDVINVNFGDRTVGIPPWVEYLGSDGETKGYDPREQIDLAYVLTTHKTQGSEYENVAYVLNKSAYSMLYRNNFYTAVTRARKCVYVIGDQRSVQNAVVNRDAPINKFKGQTKGKK